MLRQPVCSFVKDELRLENSQKFVAIWLEAFAIYSITWAVGGVLSEQGKKELDVAMRSVISKNKGDYSTYSKIKKRQMQTDL